MKPADNHAAKNALINILAFPGLGSFRAGRRRVGVGQIGLVLAGSVLLLWWLFKELSQYYALMFDNVNPQSYGWLGVTGAILFGAAWLWSLATSISLFQESSKASAVPPRLVTAKRSSSDEGKIISALTTLPQWQRRGEIISRTFVFQDFPAAMKFVNAVAEIAEAAQHHPDVDIRWNKVTLALTTHDAGGLTEKDFALARQCDALGKF